MNNLSGMVFLMLLPSLYGAMAVFLIYIFQLFIVRLGETFSTSDDYEELYD